MPQIFLFANRENLSSASSIACCTMHCFPSAFSQSPSASRFRLHFIAYILVLESLNNAFMKTKNVRFE